MEVDLRRSIEALSFPVLLAIIAILAWSTAETTTGPWYDATVSLQVYATSLAVSTLLVLVLVVNAQFRLTSLEASQAQVDLGIARLRAAATARPGGRGAGTAPFEAFERSAILEGLARAGVSPPHDPAKPGHDALLPSMRIQGPRPRLPGADAFRRLVRERASLIEARKCVWPAVAGPLAASIVFLAIAGPMLPGSGAFAADNYRLNTALILFLSYGLGPLVVWTVLSLRTAGDRGVVFDE